MKTKRKVLYIDIETSGNLALIWRPGSKISVSPVQIIKECRLICVGYRWAHEKKTKCLQWNTRTQCDKQMMVKLSKLLKQADLIIGHNGDRFDLKHIQARLLIHKLPPLGPLTTEDTLTMSRRVFNLNSHKLDYLGDILKVGRKLSHSGMQLWIDVFVHNSKTALAKMVKYCIQDVDLLMKVHQRIEPYVHHKVNIGILEGVGREACPACASEKSVKYGFITTRTGKYQKHQCQSCSHVWKDSRMVKVPKVKE